MGHSVSKNPKIDKDHHRQKMFRVGLSVGRNDLNLEGHLQMGYSSKTVKNYKPNENYQPVEDEVIQSALPQLRNGSDDDE